MTLVRCLDVKVAGFLNMPCEDLAVPTICGFQLDGLYPAGARIKILMIVVSSSLVNKAGLSHNFGLGYE